jgi:hypothetical protein
VSLPDDIAEYLEGHPDPSRRITDAIRPGLERAAAVRAAHEAAGFRFTPESRAWAREALRRARMTDEQRAESQRRARLLEAGRWPEEQ